MSKISLKYYTPPALMTLEEMIGEVKLVVFDPSKPITQPFIRVQVRFNVAKVLNMDGGKTHTIHFEYEKLQKHCFTCKRLNHEKNIFPLAVKQRLLLRKTKWLQIYITMIPCLECWKKSK